MALALASLNTLQVLALALLGARQEGLRRQLRECRRRVEDAIHELHADGWASHGLGERSERAT